MREILTVSDTAQLEGVDVVQMTAEIHSDESSQMYRNISILNHDLYKENLEYFRGEIDKFDEVVQEREDYIFKFYDVPEEPIDSDGDAEDNLDGNVEPEPTA